MAWLRSLAIGFGFGALASVTPIELAVVVLAGACLFALTRKPERHRQLALSGFIALSIAGVATQLPFKWFDTDRASLDSTCVPLSAAIESAKWRAESVPSDLLERETCFTSRQPSLREVQTALFAQGLTVDVRYCGNSATLLWGRYPLNVSVGTRSN